MDDFVSTFDKIVLVLIDCEKLLEDLIPNSGADAFITSAEMEDAKQTGPIRDFDENGITLYVSTFRELINKLKPALSLAERLSIGSTEMLFTSQGLRKLSTDIYYANAIGKGLHFDAYNALLQIKEGSPQADVIKTAYSMATDLYSNLSKSVRKASPKGQLPALDLLKPLTQPPT